ncbi:MAG: GTP-binding protein [Candidatus Altiarchaeota archaeon]|nr:GTP-binding protein [Candidatus Altiarchaeota archaeon]
MDINQRIKAVEDEIKNTKYNKATQHHIGKLKAKMAILRETAEKRSSGGGGVGFGVKRSGHATVVLLGLPSVGKSTLLNRLTNASSEVGTYDFTTLDVIPGMMEYKGVKIQVLDLPGVIGGASQGKGRGREVLSIVRGADLVLIISDVRRPNDYDVMKNELYNVGVRLDESPPKVYIKKRSLGGVNLTSTTPLKRINLETVRGILNIYGIHNADIVLHEDLSEDRFIDAVSGNRTYIPSVLVLNKADLMKEEHEVKLGREYVRISADKDENFDELKERIFEKLDMIRVYLKPQGGEADLNEPLIMRKGSTVGVLCDNLHKDFRRKFKYAIIFGASVKYQNQRKGLSHILKDKDIVTIIKDK